MLPVIDLFIVFATAINSKFCKVADVGNGLILLKNPVSNPISPNGQSTIPERQRFPNPVCIMPVLENGFPKLNENF